MARKHRLKTNTYGIVADAIERGIQFGWNRSYKHSDKPSEETIRMNIHNAIMTEVCEVINFESE